MQLAGRLQRLEQYYAKEAVKKIDVLIDGFKVKVNHPDVKVTYDPYSNSEVGTFEKFHADDKSIVKLMLGAFGSGKSTACIHDIILHTYYHHPKMHDGVRRARWLVIRNTMAELESTTLMTWDTWFGQLGKVIMRKKPLLTRKHYYRDDKGDVELEIIFIGLDRPEDKKKLESLETTGAYLNEMQHIPRAIFEHLGGRIGRFPRKEDLVGKPKKVIGADTNPPDQDHWIFTDFEENPIEGNTIFHQPPGLIKNEDGEWIDNSGSDNHKHLSDSYYFDMARIAHFREEYIKVYCRGEYGIVIPGKPVYPEYNDDLHSVNDIAILPNLPILMQWDFGTTPCCLLSQFTESGQKRNFKEFCTMKSSVYSLARDIVKPWIDLNLKGFEIISVGDPSGVAHGQGFGIGVYAILQKIFGFDSQPAKTNDISPRIEAVRELLGRITYEGQPAYILSRQGCPILRKAMSGKYCYKRIQLIGEEVYRDIPAKTHPHSDIADADQYGTMECLGDGIREFNEPQKYEDFEFIEGYSEVGGY